MLEDLVGVGDLESAEVHADVHEVFLALAVPLLSLEVQSIVLVREQLQKLERLSVPLDSHFVPRPVAHRVFSRASRGPPWVLRRQLFLLLLEVLLLVLLVHSVSSQKSSKELSVVVSFVLVGLVHVRVFSSVVLVVHKTPMILRNRRSVEGFVLGGEGALSHGFVPLVVLLEVLLQVIHTHVAGHDELVHGVILEVHSSPLTTLLLPNQVLEGEGRGRLPVQSVGHGRIA